MVKDIEGASVKVKIEEELRKFDKPKREYLKSLLELDSREIENEEIDR